jgi:non-canonical purine NTP pyrophosphatase (RdgB/HAM1 family)
MLAAIGAEGIARTAARLGDTRATARCALLLSTPPTEILAEGTTEGRLVLPPRGEGGFGWDPIFQPDGHEQTFAELPGLEKDRISHRGRAWRRLESRLRSRSHP